MSAADDLAATLRGEVFSYRGRRYRFMTRTEKASIRAETIVQCYEYPGIVLWLKYFPKIDKPVIDLGPA